jgi:outer membrane protein OmpA-like peptidoglycan-associated protein
MSLSRYRKSLVVGGLLMLPFAGSALAASLPGWMPGDWILRAGASWSDPQGNGAELPASTTIEIDNAGPELSGDVTWMFAEHWGVEFFTTLPFEHDLIRRDTRGSAVAGNVELVPITLSLQYHFLPQATFRPYVGAGLTYGWVDGDEIPTYDFDDDIGYGVGAGIDMGPADKPWFFNLAVKYIDLSIDGDVNTGGDQEFEVDPLVYSAQVGYRFGHAAAPVAAAAAAPVAAAAPAAAPKDSDGDGVLDANDKCPDTTKGDRVGPNGCSCDVSVQLQFEFDSDKLTAEDKAVLDRIAPRLVELQFIGGEAGGHTDSVGDDAYNLDLSKRRAQSVIDYLATKGITGRFTPVGYGETMPIADNATAEGRAKNRRVVLRRTDCGPAK